MSDLDRIQVGAAALTGTVYVGRIKKNEPGVWTDKRPAEAECFAAVIDHLQHGQTGRVPMAKTISMDGGETWWKVTVEPAGEPTDPNASKSRHT